MQVNIMLDYFPCFPNNGSTLLTKFVCSGEGWRQTIVLNDRTAPLWIAHGPDVSHPQGVAGCGPTKVLETQTGNSEKSLEQSGWTQVMFSSCFLWLCCKLLKEQTTRSTNTKHMGPRFAYCYTVLQTYWGGGSGSPPQRSSWCLVREAGGEAMRLDEYHLWHTVQLK